MYQICVLHRSHSSGASENSDLFLLLCLLSTLIPHEKSAFGKRPSHWRHLKTPALCFSVDGKQVENEAFRKRRRYLQ